MIFLTIGRWLDVGLEKGGTEDWVGGGDAKEGRAV